MDCPLDCRSHTWMYFRRLGLGFFTPDRLNADWLQRLGRLNREDIIRGHKWSMTSTYGILQFNIEVDQDSVISMLMCIYGGPITVAPLNRTLLATELATQRDQLVIVPFGIYPILPNYPNFDTYLLEFMG